MVNKLNSFRNVFPQLDPNKQNSGTHSASPHATVPKRLAVPEQVLASAKARYNDKKQSQTKPSVLILTGGKGNGHRCPAQAVEQAFKAKGSKAIDFHYVDLKMNGIERNWKHDLKFKLTNEFGILNSMAHRQSHQARQALRDTIISSLVETTPDAIYVNYDVLSHQLGKVMRDMAIDTKIVMASADHGAIHRDWYPKILTSEQSEHLFLVPDKNQTGKAVKSDATADALKRGVPGERIRFEGYPVRREFVEASAKSRSQCRAELGIHLPPGKTKILLGMVGTGHWTKNFGNLIVEASRSPKLVDTHIIVIASASETLKKELKEQLGDSIDVRGTCDALEVAQLMRAADVVATKAGGSSLHECNAVQTPPLIYMALSGVESENARHAVEQGTGVLATDFKQFTAIASDLLGDPEARKLIECEQAKHYDASSSEKIADLIMGIALEAFEEKTKGNLDNPQA